MRNLDLAVNLAVKEFFELWNIYVDLVDRYTENPSRLQEQYHSFMRLCEEGLPTRDDLEAYRSQAYACQQVPSSFRDRIVELIEALPQVEVKGEKAQNELSLEGLLQLGDDYFKEAGRYVIRDPDYAKEMILDFFGERDSYYYGRGLYLLPNFNDFLRRAESEAN